ncbi:hypothetical protein EST38_g2103 [Candolleomyces aberdarensis]|uniref:Nephrocystin 3-like N-terminal domain-containing protein n=1 Tax=Candolleomyces aberdarensis TaxID=2316362 RepID=A0A4Q2DVH5_9AGAR|nr:hypothetical protein EST38_g2103 [Candolleomyces aberdarensis]
MSESPPAHVEIFSNAHNTRIGEQTINIFNGNHYVSSSDQANLTQLLQPIFDASHARDIEISPPNSACFPGTRITVIRTIVTWADSTLLWNTHVLWLYGFVGCGKSAIALAIALKFERRSRLVGSFFFFRNTGDRSRMTKFAVTLAFQMAANIPEAAPFIKKAVTEKGLLGLSLVAQLRRLVYEPFKAAAKRGRLLKTFLLKGPFLIVIDGLDECEDRKEVEAFIDDMLDFFKKNPLVPLRFLITSRVEQHIQGRLEKDQVYLENLVNHCSRADIDTFMQACFDAEKQRNSVIKAYIRNHGDWPVENDKQQLVDHIGGSFIFASALFKYIVDPTDDRSTPMDRLPHTLDMNPGLDTLYAKTLSRSQHLPYFSDIVSTLALIFEPLPITGIAELLRIEPFEFVRVLVNLQAIIHIPGTDNLPVTMCHTSLRDFLTTKSRSGHFFTPPSYHLRILYQCSTLHDDGQQTDTAAALYSIRCSAKHIELFTHLPPAAQGPIPCFPQTLDALYTHVLAKSENDLHFPDIISTIVLLCSPISVAEISELLGIETFKVIQVLVNLQPVINVPEIVDPVTICHPSIHQFLTTKSQSGHFFVPPSYHLKLSYHYFSLSLKHMLSHTLLSPVASQSFEWRDRCRWHWRELLEAISEPAIYNELEQLTHLPSQTFPYQHIFSFTQLFLWVLKDLDPKPQQNLLALTKCIESLALALECDHTPDKWLQYSFSQLVNTDILKAGLMGPLEIHEGQAMALQHNMQRVEAAIRAKGFSHHLEHSWGPNVNEIHMHLRLSKWTVMGAYLVLKWLFAHAQAAMNPTGPGVTCVLRLEVIVEENWKVKIRIQTHTQPFAT